MEVLCFLAGLAIDEGWIEPTTCHAPIPQTGEEDVTNPKHSRENRPMNIIKRKKLMLELKLISIHRCRMNQHSAEATDTHFQHRHVHHNYSIDIKYIIAEMKYRQQTYLSVKNSFATSYVAATFHPTIGQRAHQSLSNAATLELGMIPSG